jgi:hypothetical protein
MPEQAAAPSDDYLKWRKSVDDRLNAEHRAPQLIEGLTYPLAPYGGAGAPTGLWYIPVTAATFTRLQDSEPWLCTMERLVRKGILVRVPWTTDAATTGELRLEGGGGIQGLTPNEPTAAVVLPAASSGIVTFRWLHGAPLWGVGASLFVAARRTGGAGNVNIGYPFGGVVQIDPRGCTVTGQ